MALFSILQKLCSRLLTFSLPVFWHFLQRFGRKVCFSSNSKVFTSQTLEALSWRTIKFKLNSQRNAKKNYSKIKVQRSEYCLTKNKIFAILFCDTIFSLFELNSCNKSGENLEVIPTKWTCQIGILEEFLSIFSEDRIKNVDISSSVDGIYGGDGVEPDSGILGIVDGPKKMVFLRITVTKYTDRQRWPSSGKRTFISPTSGKFHSGYGTAPRSVSLCLN